MVERVSSIGPEYADLPLVGDSGPPPESPAKPGDITNENDDVHIVPFAMAKPTEGALELDDEQLGGDEKIYRREHFHLGQLYHLAIQRELDAIPHVSYTSAAELPLMDDYRAHLNREYPGMGDNVFETIISSAQEISAEIRTNTPEGFDNPLFIGELPFIPGIEQQQVLFNAVSTNRLNNLAKELGFESDGAFAREILRDPEFELDVTAIFPQLKSLSLSDIAIIANASTYNIRKSPRYDEYVDGLINRSDLYGEYFDGLSDLEYLCKSVMAVSSYFYLNFSNEKPSDLQTLDNILNGYNKLILSAKAKADLISISSLEGDTEAAEVAADFKASLRGNFFGYKRMLDINALLEFQGDTNLLDTYDKFIRYIQDGRIAFSVYEVKGRYLKSETDEKSKALRPGYKTHLDIGHTLFSMAQFLNSIANGRWNTNSNFVTADVDLFHVANIGELSSAERADLSSRLFPKEPVDPAIEDFSLVDFLRPPNQHYVVNIYWPVVQRYKIGDRYEYDVECKNHNKVPAPQHKINPIDSKRAFVGIRASARNYIRRVNGMPLGDDFDSNGNPSSIEIGF